LFKASDKPQRRGFAAPAGAQQRYNLTRHHSEIQAHYSLDLAELLGQPIALQCSLLGAEIFRLWMPVDGVTSRQKLIVRMFESAAHACLHP
tara:strand:+ start:187 stop:459 length:273 start_codon:yes stop_codon:yes gene_type:complete